MALLGPIRQIRLACCTPMWFLFGPIRLLKRQQKLKPLSYFLEKQNLVFVNFSQHVLVGNLASHQCKYKLYGGHIIQ